MDDLSIVIPTSAQLREWENTRALFLTAAPAFAHIFYELMKVGDHLCIFSDSFPVAATDGKHLLINPAPFFKYDPGERLFIVSHEVLHATLNHCILFEIFARTGVVPYPDGTTLPWISELGNVAADLVVNAILIDGRVGKFNTEWLYDPSLATPSDDFLTVYRRLLKVIPPPPRPPQPPGRGLTGQGPTRPGNQPPQPDPNQPPQPGQGPVTDVSNQPSHKPPTTHHGRTGFDEHLKPGTAERKDPVQAGKERNDGQWRRVTDAAIEQARLQGRLPAGLERALSRVLEPQVDWREKLSSDIHRTLGSGSWDYENPDHEWLEREIYVPGRSAYGAGDIVVGADTSGSVSDEEIAMCYAEISGIMQQLNPKRLFVLWCDAKVHQVDLLEDVGDLANIPVPKGGGGTSFLPVFEWIENQEDLQLDGLIYITDGFGQFPKKPEYPVIWGSVSPPHQPDFPFGEVVHVPRQAKGHV